MRDDAFQEAPPCVLGLGGPDLHRKGFPVFFCICLDLQHDHNQAREFFFCCKL